MTKPFNEEAAKRGEPVVQRNGLPAYFVGERTHGQTGKPLLFEYNSVINSIWYLGEFSLQGRFCVLYNNDSEVDSEHDLFMVSKKKQLWARVFTTQKKELKCAIRQTREELVVDDISGELTYWDWVGEPILLAEIEEKQEEEIP